MRSSLRFAGRTWPPKYEPSISTSPSSVWPAISASSASRSLCASTKAVLYWQSRSRESWQAEMPLTAFTKMQIAREQIGEGHLAAGEDRAARDGELVTGSART